MYALDAASGGKLWAFATAGAVRSSPVVVGGKVFIGSEDCKVRVVDPPDWLATARVRMCIRLWEL